MNNIDWDSESAVFIDPTSPETNRGSYCYLSYLLASATGCDLYEEFRIADLESVESYLMKQDHVFVALWSYPQIETCLMLNHLLKGKCSFYGYYPLIEKLGLNPAYYTEELILKGMRDYPVYFSDFKHLLLSDCDLHLKEKGMNRTTVYPMFTSYGCPMGCTFCSATKNQKKRIVMDVDDVVFNLNYMHRRHRHGIHFTDEDFFFDTERAFNILLRASDFSEDFKFIALGCIESVAKFTQFLQSVSQPVRDRIWKVLHLIEIGLETASTEHEKEMGKHRGSGIVQYNIDYLLKHCPTKILWLTMTFAPGETISSIAQTGKFLRKHGLNTKELEDRIVSNGTEGGLGQFFQYYDGTYDKNRLLLGGEFLTERPMRLLPSYLPRSFLDCIFTINKRMYFKREGDLFYWMDVYNVLKYTDKWVDAMAVTEQVEQFHGMEPARFSVESFVRPDSQSYTEASQNAIFLALCARLGIIEEIK